MNAPIKIVNAKDEPMELSSKQEKFVNWYNAHLNMDENGYCKGQCGEDVNSDFVPEGDCHIGCALERHHYHCQKCGGISQVG